MTARRERRVGGDCKRRIAKVGQGRERNVVGLLRPGRGMYFATSPPKTLDQMRARVQCSKSQGTTVQFKKEERNEE